MLRNEKTLAKYVETYIVADLTNGFTLDEIRTQLQHLTMVLISKRNLGRVLAQKFTSTYKDSKRLYFIAFKDRATVYLALMSEVQGLQYQLDRKAKLVESLKVLCDQRKALLIEYGILESNGYRNPNAMKIVRIG